MTNPIKKCHEKGKQRKSKPHSTDDLMKRGGGVWKGKRKNCNIMEGVSKLRPTCEGVKGEKTPQFYA